MLRRVGRFFVFRDETQETHKKFTPQSSISVSLFIVKYSKLLIENIFYSLLTVVGIADVELEFSASSVGKSASPMRRPRHFFVDPACFNILKSALENDF
jgi:hypothetical protein